MGGGVDIAWVQDCCDPNVSRIIEEKDYRSKYGEQCLHRTLCKR